MRYVLIAGPLCLIATLIAPPPDGLTPAAWAAAGLTAWMALWWLTEAAPLAATALIPLAAAPLAGLSPLADVAPAYAHPLIVLFLGGFLLAKALERWGLHRWLAVSLLRRGGGGPRRTLALMMAVTAFLSLWVSNTASAMVLAPIGAAIAAARPDDRRFGAAIMLGIAFAATIGGMGSLIGTPPNAIFAAYAGETMGVEITFASWAAMGVPTALVLLVIAWTLLARWSPGFAAGGAVEIGASVPRLGPGARRVGLIAALTAAAWVLRPAIEWAAPGLPLSDAGVAMVAAVLLFSAPSGERGRLLDWETAATLRWDVLILFGGGLALAGTIEAAGLSAAIGQGMSGQGGMPVWLFVLIIAAAIVYIGELASNTAMAAIFLPVAGASAGALGVDPMTILPPVALAASIGFMLPVATPPNAIVFGHDAVDRPAMLRAGAPLDVIGIVLAAGMGALLGPLVF